MKQTEKNGEEISFNLNKNNNNRRQKRKDDDDRTEKTVMEHKREEMLTEPSDGSNGESEKFGHDPWQQQRLKRLSTIIKNHLNEIRS